MLKSLLTTTLVAIACVLSFGAGGGYVFTGHYQLQRIEPQAESGSAGLRDSTIGFELSIPDLPVYIQGGRQNPSIDNLLYGGGRVVIVLSRQSSGINRPYNRITMLITNQCGSWGREIEITLSPINDTSDMPIEYLPHWWENMPYRRQNTDFGVRYLNPDQIFTGRVMARLNRYFSEGDAPDVIARLQRRILTPSINNYIQLELMSPECTSHQGSCGGVVGGPPDSLASNNASGNESSLRSRLWQWLSLGTPPRRPPGQVPAECVRMADYGYLGGRGSNDVGGDDSEDNRDTDSETSSEYSDQGSSSEERSEGDESQEDDKEGCQEVHGCLKETRV